MGYYMNLMEIEKFKIKKDNIEKAVKALNELGKNSSHLMWVNENIMATETDIEKLMREVRWEGFINEEGDFELEYFNGEKYGSDDDIFNTIAPYVEEGSYIQMQGEDGAMWRWIFKDGKCIEKAPKIIWD